MRAAVYKKFGALLILFGVVMWPLSGFSALGPIVLGVALVASPLIIEFASGFARHAEKTALEEWTGSYYRWGTRQIRILEKDGCAWVLDEDLISAAGMTMDNDLRRKLEISYAGYCVIPGTKARGFNEHAVLKFLNGKQERNPEIVKLKLWFERDVFFPLRKKRELGAVAPR